MEVTEGKKKNRRFDARDWNTIAEMICDDLESRKKKRKDREKEWAEVDRQIRMEPDTKFKLLPNGAADVNRAWMAEMELPLQAQALEILTADARRMMFPDSGPWFAAHALLSDKYLARVDMTDLIAGDENQIPSKINQDNADKIVESYLNHIHRMYDFEANLDLVNAEAFKYGMGISRTRLARKSTFMKTARGVEKDDHLIPVTFPRSIKSVYLDDKKYTLMNEGLVMGPSTIACKTQLYEDLVLAANKGSNDPDKEDGGWMPAQLKGLKPDKNNAVELIEYEGDLIVPRKSTSSIYLPGVIVTVAKGPGDNGKAYSRVVRFRFRKTPMSSYVEFPYHRENVDCAYASAPLMKGRVIQSSATHALNRTMDSAALKCEPVIQYSRDDAVFAQQGGPRVFPGSQLATLDPVSILDIGDPAAMFAIYGGLTNQYADLTGITAARLGAQTVSHTTAFAKDAEIQRGTVRTVDYVRSSLKGPLNQILNMEYELGRANFKGTYEVYSDSYHGWIKLEKDTLPDRVIFEAHGSGGPAEAQQKIQARLASLQLSMQMDQINVQQGGEPTVNIPAAIEQILREGGWVDVSAIIRTEDVSAGPAGAPPVPSIPGVISGAPGAIV